MSKTIFVVIIVAAVVGGIWWYMQQGGSPAPMMPSAYEQKQAGQSADQTTDPDVALSGEVKIQPVIIRYTDAGFSPVAISVKKGTTVAFKNDSGQDTWPASAIHPTHQSYPTTGGCMGSTFDACRGLKPGESWDFTFDTAGKWNYHDHLHARQFGSVTVEE